jgi:hypothetical protein
MKTQGHLYGHIPLMSRKIVSEAFLFFCNGGWGRWFKVMEGGDVGSNAT